MSARGFGRKMPIVVALALLLSAARSATAQYDPPGGYYNSATGTGLTLKTQLRAITASNYWQPGSTSHLVRTYGDARYAPAVLDTDPGNPANILLIYNRASVSSTWDPLVPVWNREHVWPLSRGLGGSVQNSDSTNNRDATDLFNLRPCNTQINEDRANSAFGTFSGSGSCGYRGTYWYPGDADRGDVARGLFYMAVRYDGSESGTTDLELANGDPSGNMMGDLAALLRWHYTDPPDTFERRRNHMIFSSSANPSYYQGNRNPFIDRAEFVWTIFGGGSNNSKLYVGASPPADGASTANVSLGRVMRNGTIGSASVTLNKTGTHPTTYDISGAGAGTTSAAGVGQTFDYNAQSRSINVGLTAPTATTGLKTGSITINNTDLTSGGTGLGSADGDDIINLSAVVVDNRVVTASGVDFGRAIILRTYTRTTKLTTTGSDGSFTRVTVSGDSASADEVTVLPGASQLFDDPSDSVTRSVGARFYSPGLKGGVVPLVVSGEGLAGESVNGVAVSWSARVIDRVDASDLPPLLASLVIDFGSVSPAGAQSRSFPIEQWLGSAGLDARIEPGAISTDGDIDRFGINLDPLVAGSADDLLATLDTSLPGEFAATYHLSLSSGQPLEVVLQAVVLPEPLGTLPILLLSLLPRRLPGRASDARPRRAPA